MTIKTVSILGGAGFVGSHIVAKLDSAGYHVKILTRRRESAKHLFLLPKVQVIECDVMNNHALKQALMGSDAIINLIGVLQEDKKNTFEQIHHQLPRRVAQICNDLSIKRLLHMSALQASNNAPSQYLKSKAAGEAAVSEFNKKLAITIFKPSVIFGRNDQFINLFANLIKFLPVIVLAKPNAKFQPIWVEDVASAFVNAIQNTATYNKTYDLGGPKVYTLRELLQKVMGFLGKKRPIIGLNDSLSTAQGFMMEFLPVKLMSRDNILSMQVDNIASQKIAPELDVNPTELDVIVPEYLNDTSSRSAYDGFRTAAGRSIKLRR